MLGNKDAAATVAVKDVKAARPFYEGTLGLKVEDGQSGVLKCLSGDSTLLVYESKFAGTNKATAVTWAVDDLEAVVGSLRAKGVDFEHYDLPGMAQKGDVHVAGSMKAVPSSTGHLEQPHLLERVGQLRDLPPLPRAAGPPCSSPCAASCPCRRCSGSPPPR